MKEISSKALEANIAEFSVYVTIDRKYNVIQEVMSRYDGLQKPLNTFLEELCHPRRNWQFIVNEYKTFSLGYFYDLKTHSKGPEAVKVYIEIAIDAIKQSGVPTVKTSSYNNLYLLLQKFIKESGSELVRFQDVINHGFVMIMELEKDNLSLVAESYYQLNRIAEAYLENASEKADFGPLNSLLKVYYEYTYSYWLAEHDPLEWFQDEIKEPLTGETAGLFIPISHA